MKNEEKNVEKQQNVKKFKKSHTFVCEKIIIFNFFCGKKKKFEEKQFSKSEKYKRFKKGKK